MFSNILKVLGILLITGYSAFSQIAYTPFGDQAWFKLISTPAGAGAAQKDPSTNGTLTGYWMGSDKVAEADGTGIQTWTDKTGNFRNWLNAINPPTKQTTDGKTVLRFASISAQTYLQQGISLNQFFATNQGTIIIRCKLASTAQAPILYWSGGGEVITCWIPYDTDVYFDWSAADATGRINTTNPAGLANNWHTIIYRRATDGTQSIRIDGTTVVSATKTAVFTWAGTGDLCLASTSGGSANWMNVDMGGMAFFNENQSDEDADAHGEWIENH